MRNLIKITDVRKNIIFTEMFSGFKRYKEPLVIKEAIINLCKENGHITSSELKRQMNYKETNTAIKWLQFYLNQGLLKYISKSYYGKGNIGRVPAKYVLNKP